MIALLTLPGRAARRMDEQFDAYYKWLSIPPEEQPPHHYRLLGVKLWEADPEVIDNAANRQTTHIRTYQTGKNSDWSQRILNEISAARICLLQPAQRAAYDARLREQLSPVAPSLRPRRPLPRDSSVDDAVIVLDDSHAGQVVPTFPVARPPVAIPTFPVVRQAKEVQTFPVVRRAEPAPTLPPVRTAETVPTFPVVVPAPQVVVGGKEGHSPPSAPPEPPRPLLSPEQTEFLQKNWVLVVAGGAGVMVLLLLLVLVFSGGSPAETALAFEWPEADRQGLEVSVDGRPISVPGQGAWKHAAPVGSHTIEARRRGFENWSGSVVVAEGKVARVSPPEWKAAKIATPMAESNPAESNPMAEFKPLDPLPWQPPAVAGGPPEAGPLEVDVAPPAAVPMDLIPDAPVPAAPLPPVADADPSQEPTPAQQALVKRINQWVSTATKINIDHRSLMISSGWITSDTVDFRAAPRAGQPTYLCIAVKVTNGPLGAPLDVASWSGKNHAVLCNPAGRALPFGRIEGKTERLMPGDTAEQVLVFQAPSPLPDFLRLALSLEPIGVSVPFGFELKRDFFQAASITPAVPVVPLAVPQPLAPAPPAAPLPATLAELRDPALRSSIPGVNAKSEAAVALSLKWLADHQMPDGGWNFEHRTGGCQSRCGNAGALTEARSAATGMALMAFLGAGHTHKKGVYKTTVQKGLMFLLSRMKLQAGRGDFMENGGSMYSHGIASIALCEAYAMTKDRGLLQPAQLALDHIVYAQDPAGGGWRYQARQAGDTSVVGWQLTALKTGHLGSLRVPPATIKGVSTFLDGVQTEGGAKYGYSTAGAGPACTAIGLLSRMNLGWKRDNPALQEGVKHLLSLGPSPQNLYFNYYAAQVMHQYGGEEASLWNEKLRNQLVASQSNVGHEAGSWFVVAGDHGSSPGGRLYCTALSTLVLETAYRHPPLLAPVAPPPPAGAALPASNPTIAQPAGVPIPLARFTFDRDLANSATGTASFEISPRATLKQNALSVAGGYDSTPGCMMPDLDYAGFTIALRFQAEEFTSTKSLLIVGGKLYRWFELGRSPNGSLQVSFNNQALVFPVSGTRLDERQWAVAACSVDARRRQALVFLNGKKVKEIQLPPAFQWNFLNSGKEQSEKGWYFTNHSNGKVFHGMVDELLVYGSPLSEQEMEKIPLRP